MNYLEIGFAYSLFIMIFFGGMGLTLFYRWALRELIGGWMTRPQLMKWYRQRIINQMIWKLDTQYHNDPGYNAVVRLLRAMKELE